MLQKIVDKVGLTDLYSHIRSVTPTTDIYVGILLASFFINLLGLALPIFVLVVYQRIIPHHGYSTLALMVVGVIIALILEAILKICRSWVSAWSDARYEYMSLKKGINNVFHSNIEDFEKTGAAVYLEQLNAVYSLKNFFGGQALLSIVDIPFVILYLVVIAYLAGPLVLIPIAMLILFAWAVISTSQTLSKELEARYKADDRRISYVVSILKGIHTIKSMAIENPMLRRYEKLQATSSAASYNVGLTGAVATTISNSAMQVTTASVVAIGAYWVIMGHLSVGGLAACILLAARTLQPIGRAIEVLTRLQGIKLAENRLETLTEMPLERGLDFPVFPSMNGAIEIKDLGFRYAEDKPWIFKGITLSIREKEIIAIEGGNFAGKSTFLWMLLGMFYPEQGKILIDGSDISKFNPISIRESVAYLPQRGVLFNGNILENLTMFRPELSEKAKMIAEEWGIAADIRKLPGGYDTRVGKTTSEHLSPGLRELIAIARPFVSVNTPKIILFDEANRYLDLESDAIVQQALMKYKDKSTMIIISSRPSMLSMADRRFAMSDMALQEVRT